ncbi:hypothetical protein GCM10022205_32760 [Spinactinospora alkalitolerans]
MRSTEGNTVAEAPFLGPFALVATSRWVHHAFEEAFTADIGHIDLHVPDLLGRAARQVPVEDEDVGS